MNLDNLRKVASLLRIDVTGVRHSDDGDWLVARCPFALKTHAGGIDNKPSFGMRANPAGNSGYHCFSCGSSGLLNTLPSRIFSANDYHIDDIADVLRNQMLQIIALEADVQVSGDSVVEIDALKPPLDEFDAEALNLSLPLVHKFPEAMAYLESRGISAHTARRLDLRYSPISRRIHFMVYDEEASLYGSSGRAIDPGTQPKVLDFAGLPKKQLILGSHLWTPGRRLILVEGLFAYAHLHEVNADAESDIGAILGSNMTRIKARLCTCRDVVLMLDNDTAGWNGVYGPMDGKGRRRFEKGAAGMIEAAGGSAFVPVWPEGKVDPDELTSDEVRNMVECATRYFDTETP